MLYVGYEHMPGKVFESNDLEIVMSGLRDNNLLKYSHMLTGN